MSRIASEVMESHVLSVSPEASLIDVQRLFVEEEIHGAPVVANDGLVGIISTFDLVGLLEKQE